MSDAGTELTRLLAVMAALRDPATGCPWDKEQDFASIAPYTIEEAYEVADAIAANNMPALADELGDLLFQVVYHARLAEEGGAFTFADIARAITAKMIRRHPHVFADAAGFPPGTWEAQKSAERAARAEHGVLAGISVTLPALSRAAKLTARAARVGFDWPNAEAVLEKLHEEVAELRAELPAPGKPAQRARLADEMGDLLFVLANLARKLDLDAETCLHQANRKFERRFNAVEARLLSAGTSPAEAGLEAMEEAWRAVKRNEAQPASRDEASG